MKCWKKSKSFATEGKGRFKGKAKIEGHLHNYIISAKQVVIITYGQL